MTSLCQMFSHLYVLETLYDGFYLLDSDLKFALWNRGISNLLGRSASQMLGTWARPHLAQLVEDLGEIATVESEPLQEGRNMTMLLAPTREATRKPKGDSGDAAESKTLCMHGDSKRENREILLVSVRQRWRVIAWRNGQ